MLKLLFGFLPRLVLGLLERWGWRRAGVKAERQRRLEETLKRVMEREKLERDVRDDEDDALIDRLSDDR